MVTSLATLPLSYSMYTANWTGMQKPKGMCTRIQSVLTRPYGLPYSCPKNNEIKPWPCQCSFQTSPIGVEPFSHVKTFFQTASSPPVLLSSVEFVDGVSALALKTLLAKKGLGPDEKRCPRFSRLPRPTPATLKKIRDCSQSNLFCFNTLLCIAAGFEGEKAL